MSMFRRSQNRVMTEELLPAANTARDLAQYAISRGQSAQETGDVQTARKLYEAALSFGLCLSRPERLATSHLVARAIVAMAEEQLATLEK